MRRWLCRSRIGISALVLAAVAIAGAYTAAAQTQITFWHWEDMQFMLDQWNEAIAEFERENPGVTVQMTQVNYWDYPDKVAVAYAAGAAPDILLVSLRHQTPYGLVDSGLLLPLEPFIRQSNFDVEDFFPILKSWTINNHLVALPRSNDAAHAIFYNEDLFDQAGVMNPGDLARRGAWNFNALLETAQRMTIDRNGDGTADVAGIGQLCPHCPEHMVNFVMLNGGRVFSPDFRRVLINEPAAVRAIEFMAEINRVGTAPNVGGFDAGRMAMVSDWLDRFAAYAGPGPIALPFNWDVAPYPSNGSKVQTFEHSPSYGIVSTSKNPDLAWKLLQKFVSRETQREWVVGGFEPVRISIARSPAWLDHPTGVKNLDITYNERVVTSEGFPYYYGVEEALEVLIGGLRKISEDDANVSVAINEVFAAAQSALTEAQAGK